jgi:hypothetical protein
MKNAFLQKQSILFFYKNKAFPSGRKEEGEQKKGKKGGRDGVREVVI